MVTIRRFVPGNRSSSTVRSPPISLYSIATLSGSNSVTTDGCDRVPRSCNSAAESAHCPSSCLANPRFAQDRLEIPPCPLARHQLTASLRQSQDTVSRIVHPGSSFYFPLHQASPMNDRGGSPVDDHHRGTKQHITASRHLLSFRLILAQWKTKDGKQVIFLAERLHLTGNSRHPRSLIRSSTYVTKSAENFALFFVQASLLSCQLTFWSTKDCTMPFL